MSEMMSTTRVWAGIGEYGLFWGFLGRVSAMRKESCSSLGTAVASGDEWRDQPWKGHALAQHVGVTIMPVLSP